MNVPEIERLVEMVQKANISELTLRQDSSRITIRKTPSGASTGMELTPYRGNTSDVDDYTEKDGDADGETRSPPDLVTIFSPLVGHFRHIRPMVGLGARVAKGQVVGVIEAVKLINEITSPAAGKVTDVLVEDGQAVEYGQELFAVQPGN